MQTSAAILFLSLAMVAAGCGGAASQTPATDAPAEAAEPAEVVTSTTTFAPPAATDDQPVAVDETIDEVDLVTYVAAIEDALAGTGYEGAALDAPEVFLATSSLFCGQLAGGMTTDEVLTSYIETLTGGTVEEASDDDLALAGSVLGVGVVTLCPEHLATLAASA